MRWARPNREFAQGRHRQLKRKIGVHTDTAREDALLDWKAMSDGPEITEFLARAAQGDDAAIDALIPHIYDTLRRLAHRQRAREAAHTLETTALVHEAYLALARQSGFQFVDRAHFYAYVARLMRHALIDRVRRHGAQKRQAVDMAVESTPEPVDVLALDEAMNKLIDTDPRLARVAELRLFVGLSTPEIGDLIGVATRTVERDWLKARTFLSACLISE
jgi:RNA polymerase sigma factor (TIGR02999 family)